MINALLDKWNTLRKKKFFSSVLYRSEKNYAFVGAGIHSLTNLYPVLRHCGITLKVICTKKSADTNLQRLFPGCKLTHDIQDIISDPEIAGVFVCASPASHHSIVSLLLRAGKKVFVEKPPCQDLAQLQDLIAINQQAVCKVGLQRRYWPGNRFAVPRIRKAKTYNYSFHTGPYIQGDALTELFIHPLDYCLFLFGAAETASLSYHNDKTGITIQLHLKHHSGISGLIELSTCHSWNDPSESLNVDCRGESLLIEYPSLIQAEQKPARILNIPSERVLNQPVTIRKYFSSKNLLLPVAELNTLLLQGFYQEIESFVGIVEDGATKAINNDLQGLIPLFELFEKIRSGDA